MCDARNDCFDGSDEDPVECIKEGILERTEKPPNILRI